MGRASGVEQELSRWPVAGLHLARGVRRPWGQPGDGGDLPVGVRPGRSTGPGRLPRRDAARPDHPGPRHRGAADDHPPPAGPQRSGLVSGVLGAGCRLGPGQYPYPARLDGDEWVVEGQKVWTTFAHRADWTFVLARTEPGSVAHAGISYLLVPLDQPAVDVRPIRTLVGDSGFCEVFYQGARTPAANVVGGVGDGWRTAMSTRARTGHLGARLLRIRLQHEPAALLRVAPASTEALPPAPSPTSGRIHRRTPHPPLEHRPDADQGHSGR